MQGRNGCRKNNQTVLRGYYLEFKMQNRLKSVLALSAVLIATTVQAENWPQWRGPNNDGISSAKGLPGTWSKTENVAW